MDRRAIIVLGVGGACALLALRAFARDPAEDVGTVDGAGFLGVVNDTVEALGGDMTQGEQRNVNAFLAMVRAAEGTAGPNGYRMLFGGALFQSFADHPRVRFYGEWLEVGKTSYTTAAGAYQITATTFDRLADALDLSDFSPASQDAMALELVRERGALADVKAGAFEAAVSKVAGIWASLPGAPYPQRQRTAQFVRTAYETAGGRYVA